MRGIGLALLLLFVASAQSAKACNSGDAEFALEDIKQADLVVVGRIANYRVLPDLRDPVAHMRRYELLQEALKATPEQMESLRRSNYSLSDFASFEIQVEHVLKGEASKTINVRWQNETFREPEAMPPGPYVIALRAPKLSAPPAQNHFTIFQASCSRAYIFTSESKEAAQARKLFSSR